MRLGLTYGTLLPTVLLASIIGAPAHAPPGSGDVPPGVVRPTTAMAAPRAAHSATALFDGRVLVTGGADERDMDGVYDSTELFDPATGTSTVGRPLVRGRYKHNGSSVLLPDGSVLIAGGAAQAETYDPRTKTFTLVPGAVPMAGQFSAVAPLAAGDGAMSHTITPQTNHRRVGHSTP